MRKIEHKKRKSRILMCVICMSMLLFSCGTKEDGVGTVDAKIIQSRVSLYVNENY